MTERFTVPHGRRYDLDWLRAIAFWLLILYHVGMFYVTWGWHVKSAHAGPAAEPLMLAVNPWRLALLFFISGVAVRFASDKAPSLRGFVSSRLRRLGLPILMGMFVVVAPQTYFELREQALIEPGYLSFWSDYLRTEQLFPMTTPTWNHLWYVVYLLAYVLVLWPVLPRLRRFAEGRGGQWVAQLASTRWTLLLGGVVPFVLYTLYLAPRFPTTHALVNDWANHASSLSIFLVGYFAAKNDGFWRGVDRATNAALVLALVLLVFRLGLRSVDWEAYVALYDANVMPVLVTLYAWSSIVALLGLAQRHLNRPSAVLSYLTAAVFCHYILHQTITVSVGYWLTPLGLSVWIELVLLTIATVGGSALGYEVLRRVPVLRVFFGIQQASSNDVTSVNREVAYQQSR